MQIVKTETLKDGSIYIEMDDLSGKVIPADQIDEFIKAHSTPTLEFTIALMLKDWQIKTGGVDPKLLEGQKIDLAVTAATADVGEVKI